MAQAFPHTFFTDPWRVRPLKVNIDQDLFAALPEGVSPTQVRRFLGGYVHRPSYLKALARGQGRVDLTGHIVEPEIPDVIRQHAQAQLQRLAEARSGNPTPRPAAQPAPINREELYAMAVDAKLEVTLKFTTLPNATPLGQDKVMFALKAQDGQYITIEVSNKVWNKLKKAHEDWPAWMAALSGTMGQRTEQGFQLANPGLQVFERQPKTSAEATSSTAEVPPVPVVAAPVESAPAPLAAAAAEPANPNPISRQPVLSLKHRKTTP
jgi:sRNA-binding protein